MVQKVDICGRRRRSATRRRDDGRLRAFLNCYPGHQLGRRGGRMLHLTMRRVDIARTTAEAKQNNDQLKDWNYRRQLGVNKVLTWWSRGHHHSPRRQTAAARTRVAARS